jgi:hypothetical protein
MKWFFPFIVISLLGIVSCGSQPDVQAPAAQAAPEPIVQAPVVQAPAAPAPVVQAPVSPPAAVPFDNTSVSEEVYTSTKVDVQQFIRNLNGIIRKKDYKGWSAYLSESYLAEISSQEYLANISNSPGFKRQKIVLRTAEDYFKHVVVPSRANDRVDDIEFLSETRVKAITEAPNGQRLRLYDLETAADGTWKIIN